MKTENKRKYAMIMILSFIVAMFLVSCGNDQIDNIELDDDEPLELSVYLDGYTSDYMNALLDQFVRENPNVNITSQDFTNVNIPDFRTRLANDLMAGDGPDIVLTSNTGPTQKRQIRS